MSSKPARGHWLAPAVLLGLVALLVGLVLAPALPGAENDPILEFANSGPNRNGGRSYSTRVPPLVDVGAKLQTEDNYEVFTVQASQPEYWRLTALDDFTTEGGGQWTLSAEGGDEVDDDLPERLTDGTFHQEFDIGRLGERWLPAAFRPVAASTPALVVRSSGTLVSDEDTVQGLQYTADSRLAPLRAADHPRAAGRDRAAGPRGTTAVHHAPRRDADRDRGHRGTGRRRCGRGHSLRASSRHSATTSGRTTSTTSMSTRATTRTRSRTSSPRSAASASSSRARTRSWLDRSASRHAWRWGSRRAISETACSTCSRTTRTPGPRSGSRDSAGPISSTPPHRREVVVSPRAAACCPATRRSRRPRPRAS